MNTKKIIELFGKWENYPYHLRFGWMYPCYTCNTLTARIRKRDLYKVYICKDCDYSHLDLKKKRNLELNG
jgi:Zn-finger protein